MRVSVGSNFDALNFCQMKVQFYYVRAFITMYLYIHSLEKIEEQKLSHSDVFKGALKHEFISVTEPEFALEIWEKFSCTP